MCLSHLIYTVRPCLIHTCQAIPMPRPYHALTMPFFSRPRHGQRMAWVRNGRGLASVNQTRPHCVNQMGKTHSKPLEAWHVMAEERHRRGMGTACYVWIGLNSFSISGTSQSSDRCPTPNIFRKISANARTVPGASLLSLKYPFSLLYGFIQLLAHISKGAHCACMNLREHQSLEEQSRWQQNGRYHMSQEQ
jgi:hypothetical protein